MNVATHLANALHSTLPGDVRYDQNAKELLADVQILARILQNTVVEVSDMSVEEIIDCIIQDSIEIGKSPVEPGLTNVGKMQNENTENIVLNEGVILFDIRCTLMVRQKELKVIVNIEAQKSTSFHKLHYHIENRVVYYLSRLISSQKEVEFFNSDYDKIKKVYSIWICMDAGPEEDSITQISLNEKALYGNPKKHEHLDKMCGIIVHIRSDADVQKSKNKLITMLEDVFREEDLQVKKNNLEQNHGLKMSVDLERKLNDMCNLSEVILERGIEQGERLATIKIATNLFAKGKTFEEVCEIIDSLSTEELREIYNSIH
ncbi:MAG: hypothetical protein E7283_03625 [Lachnospiraceae bacterium]|nr:hypothetical protein [Lachnospiraceae bacterium]